MSDDFISALWQSQDGDARRPSNEDLAARAVALHRRVMWRDRIEYAAGILVAVLFIAVVIAVPDTGIRIACLVIVAGVGFTCLNLYRRRVPAPDDNVGQACRDYYRRELGRQRDALHSVWRWYLGPLVPGMVLLFVAIAYRTIPVAGWWATIRELGPIALAIAGFFFLLHLLNRLAARRLQSTIDAIDGDRS